jgi:His/Glu/Gln/Arg/opine family amino acid ABC transporter permease subunit
MCGGLCRSGVHFDLLGFGPQGYGNSLAGGFLLTISLAVASYLFSLTFGVMLGFAAGSSGRWVRLWWKPYSSLMTGIPSLLVIFFIYYNFPILVQSLIGIDVAISPFAAGTVALSLVYATYIGEVIRGAITNIPHGQAAAAQALGFRTLSIWWLIILPQVWRVAFPGLVNIWLVLLKDTALVSLVGLNDIVRVSNVATGNTGDAFLFFGLTGFAYFGCASCSVALARRIERRVNIGIAMPGGGRHLATVR